MLGPNREAQQGSEQERLGHELVGSATAPSLTRFLIITPSLSASHLTSSFQDSQDNLNQLIHMHIFDLPQELLEAILAQTSRGSLASLARVCQRLRPLVERILYQSVYLRNHDGEKFTYALDCVPARAEHVKELLIHYHYVDVEDEEEYYPLYAETLAPTIGRLVNLRTLVVKGLEFDADREEDDEIIGGYERVIAEAEKWDTLFAQSAVPGSQILPSLTKCLPNPFSSSYLIC